MFTNKFLMYTEALGDV